MTMLFMRAPALFEGKGHRGAIVMALAGGGMIAALGYGLHVRAMPPLQADKGWAGNLAVAGPTDATPAALLSSASLVVPKDQLTLPPLPAKPVVRVKASCDSADKYCVVRPATVTAVPPKRQVVASVDQSALLLPPALIPDQAASKAKTKSDTPAGKGFLASINPLNHMPDMTAVGRPFVAAGNTVTGWVKRF